MALKAPIFRPRKWGFGGPGRPLPEPWFGLDTERDAKTGKFVCGFANDGRNAVSFSSLPEVPIGTHWVWNLGYDIEGLMRDLRIEEGWAMREDGARFTLGNAKCVYYHGKRFEYRDHKGLRLFLEASSFYNRVSLAVASESFGGKDTGVDASKMSLSRYEKEPKYRALVDKYCIKDALRALQLMIQLKQGFGELGVIMGGTPGSTAKRFLANVPTFPEVIWKTQRAFLSGYCGGRFEVLKRGVFENAIQHDIISAYPWALSKCPMLTKTAESRFSNRVSDGALYGVYEVALESDEYLGVVPSWKGATRVFSAAEDRCWLMRPEVEWLQKRNADLKILRGVEIFDENATLGWSPIVKSLFDMKQRDKKSPKSLGAKVGINSLYGVMIQLVRRGGEWVPIEEAKNPVDFAGMWALEKGPVVFEAGQFYAPCYASTLTSMVRVKVLDAVLAVGEDYGIAAHTDSLLTTRKSMKCGDGLGDWKVEEKAEQLVILKSGQYAIGDKVKGRGFSKRKLNPDDDAEVAQRHKEDLWAQYHLRRKRISVKSAKSWDEVSLIVDQKVRNNIGWEVKRKWPKEFSARMVMKGEWIDSEPLIHTGRGAVRIENEWLAAIGL